MAYISKEEKNKLAPGIKAVLKKYGMKGTISVRNHLSLVVKSPSGDLEILQSMKRQAIKSNRYDMDNKRDDNTLAHIMVRKSNRYDMDNKRDDNTLAHIMVRKSIDLNMSQDRHGFSAQFDDPSIVDFLVELKSAMQGPDFYDRSDIMTDYFDVSHYIEFRVGDSNKPYVCTRNSPTPREFLDKYEHIITPVLERLADM